MSDFSHISAYPITWPAGWKRTPPDRRRRAKFHKGGAELSVMQGTDRLIAELRSLGVQSGGFIVSTNLVLRQDGLPRSDQRAPVDPGVAVYWTTGSGKPQQVMAIDHYDRVADNLGAIAATLEALRAVARHGGGMILERAFTGFTALPPPLVPNRTPWQILGIGEGADAQTIDAAWRGKIRQFRTTNPGGDHVDEAGVNAARDACLKTLENTK